MAATMQPIPDVRSAPCIPCPLPFVSQARLDRAHADIQGAYDAALKAFQRADRRWQLRAAQQAALDALDRQHGKPPGLTNLEVVAFYALLQEKIPALQEAEQGAEAGAHLAVWDAVTVL